MVSELCGDNLSRAVAELRRFQFLLMNSLSPDVLRGEALAH
jgi:hypothetical protein